MIINKKIAKEPRDWDLWYQLALASDDRNAVREALERAAELNPRSVEIANLREAFAFGEGKGPRRK